MEPKRALWSEASALAALRTRFDKPGNGGSGEYAFLTNVRDAAGFDARRTFDAVSISLWPSRGIEIHVYEIKVSRGDWLRELKKPEKAESACAKAERFSIVAPEGVVKPEELPQTWGWIELKGTPDDFKVRTRVAAPPLRPLQKTISRSFMVGLLRSCPGAIPGGKVVDPTEAQLRSAENVGFQRGHTAGYREAENEREWKIRDLKLRADEAGKLSEALRLAGVPGFEARMSYLVERADIIARALAGNRASSQLKGLRDSLSRAVEALDEHLKETSARV